MDPEDFLAEIFVALAIRNRGRCPFDPRLGAFSTYVVRVVKQRISNLARHRATHKHRLIDHAVEVDVLGIGDVGVVEPSVVERHDEMLDLERHVARVRDLDPEAFDGVFAGEPSRLRCERSFPGSAEARRTGVGRDA